MENQVSAIILAAGLSTRMGSPKFAMKFDPQKSFLEEIVDRFAEFGCGEIIIVMNKPGKRLLDKLKVRFPETVKIVINPHPETGRFSSIKIGLNHSHIQNRIFIHNVDNPFVEVDLLSLLLNNLKQADYCVPIYKNRGGHPILVSEKVAASILKFGQDDMSLKEYLMTFEKKTMETDNPKILINVNSIQDYQEIFLGLRE